MQNIEIFHKSIKDSEWIDARSLYNSLEIKRDFSNWIKDCFSRLNLIEGLDWLTDEFARSGERNGKPKERIDYFLSFRAAQKCAVTSKKYGVKIIDMLLDIQEKYFEHMKIQAALGKQIEASQDSISVGNFAQIAGDVGRNKTFKLLRDKKYLKSDNTPYQKYLDQGLFEVSESVINGKIKTQTFITGKGQIKLANIF